jgi:hypothetical protein
MSGCWPRGAWRLLSAGLISRRAVITACQGIPGTLRYGKISHVTESAPDPRMLLLREDLSKEYYAILGVVSSYDGWILIVKGWSVTFSLAGLGLGFQQRHFALFGRGDRGCVLVPGRAHEGIPVPVLRPNA